MMKKELELGGTGLECVCVCVTWVGWEIGSD
jgi:hypothetical protein